MKDQNLVEDTALGTMASMASIGIVYFLHNQRNLKNIPCFSALQENLAFSSLCNQGFHLKILPIVSIFFFPSFHFEKKIFLFGNYLL
jgi:hypothetical protein